MTIKNDTQLQILAEESGTPTSEIERKILIRLASADTIKPKEGEKMRNCTLNYTPVGDIVAILRAVGIKRINSIIFEAFFNLTFL